MQMFDQAMIQRKIMEQLRYEEAALTRESFFYPYEEVKQALYALEQAGMITVIRYQRWGIPANEYLFLIRRNNKTDGTI